MIYLKKIEKALIDKEYYSFKDHTLKENDEPDLFSNEILYLLKLNSGDILIGQIEKRWYGYIFNEKNGINFVLNLNPQEKNNESINEIYEIEILEDNKIKEMLII